MITPVPKPEVVRDESYRAFVRGLPCACGCGRPGDPHHIRHRRGFGDAGNLVPLARECHTIGHAMGWTTWQREKGVRLEPIARILWEAWRKAHEGG